MTTTAITKTQIIEISNIIAVVRFIILWNKRARTMTITTVVCLAICSIHNTRREDDDEPSVKGKVRQEDGYRYIYMYIYTLYTD